MPPETKPEVEHRQVTYRVLFDSPASGRDRRRLPVRLEPDAGPPATAPR